MQQYNIGNLLDQFAKPKGSQETRLVTLSALQDKQTWSGARPDGYKSEKLKRRRAKNKVAKHQRKVNRAGK